MSNRIRTNWAGNYRYRAARLHIPRSLTEVQELVSASTKLKALGARHSFNSIADTDGDQISLEAFRDIELDSAAGTVRVGAGVSYGQLAPYLDRAGFAVHNLASLPHISVVGACSTGTHGSGTANGNLATAVVEIEMVTGDGTVVNPPVESSTVGLGALGVVTAVTLKVEPRFDVRQKVYFDLPFDVLDEHLDQVFALGYSVSLFTDWQHGRSAQVWVKRRASEPDFEPDLFGARAATEKLHPLPGHPAEPCTEQLGELGTWYERLPHFRMEFTPSSGEELQTEYFVPLERGYEAIRAVEVLRDRITPLLYVTELRTIAADSLWLSPCYERASLAIHFTWKPLWEQVRFLLPAIEEALAPFGARPHWAKLFSGSPNLLYRRRVEFMERVESKFRNDFLDRNLFAGGIGAESGR